MLQSFEPGSTFSGSYEIVKPLSAGGMGEVFIVRHKELNELRAMKLMLPQVGRDERLRQKFQQEARIGSRIKSEHIVRVLDVGVDTNSGRPWFVMELLEGTDLRTFVDKSGPHTPETIRKIFGQLAHALAAAHKAGIVHRDLKPENIFVAASARADEAFTIKVLDFGIAKIVAEANTDMSMPIGSPLWMAPEQAEAGAGIGPQTDVWPIGLLAFYLLTGKIFWLAAHTPNATPVQVLQEIMFNPIPPASERAAAIGYRFRLPDGFDPWLARCLSRRGQDRFPDAAAAFDQLSMVLGARLSMPSAIAVPMGVAMAPAATPPTLERSQPTTIDHSHPPYRMSTTSVVSSGPVVPPKKGTSPLVWMGVVGLIAALGVGGFFVQQQVSSGSPKAGTSDPVAAKAPDAASKRSEPAESPIVPSTTTAAPATPGATTPVETPTAEPPDTTTKPTTPTAPTTPTVPGPNPNPPTTTPKAVPTPTPMPTPTPSPTQDCTVKTHIGPDGKRVRKPWCPA